MKHHNEGACARLGVGEGGKNPLPQCLVHPEPIRFQFNAVMKYKFNFPC